MTGGDESATLSGTLTVLGRTLLSSLGVTGSIQSGTLVIDSSCHPELVSGSTPDEMLGIPKQVRDDSKECGSEIYTLSGDLKLQSLGLGGIDILAGKVTIDPSGNVTVQNNVTAKGVETETITVIGSKTIGSAVLPANQLTTEIPADIASDSARVFLNPTSITAKQLVVTKKEKGKFTVGVKTASESEIGFDWWVVAEGH